MATKKASKPAEKTPAKAAKPAAKPAKVEKAAKKAAAPAKMSAGDIITLITTFEPLLEKLLAAFAKKDPTTAAKLQKQFAKIKTAAASTSDSEAEGDEDDAIDFPSAKEIAKLDLKGLKATAAKIDFDASSFKENMLRALLGALAAFIAELQSGTAPADTTSVTKELAAKLAAALSVEPGKNHKETLKNLASALAAEDEEDPADEDEEETEDEDEESEDEESEDEESEDDEDEEDEDEEESEDDESEDDDEEEEDEDDEEESDDEDEEEEDEEEDEDSEEDEEEEESDDEDEEEEEDEDLPDRDEVAKDYPVSKFPAPADMQANLKAFNKAADEDDQIEVEAGKVKVAYRQLIGRLVTTEGKVAKWGTPYNYGTEVMCCGLPLEEVTIKGVEQAGKCAVTGKTFSIDDDGEATEITKKAKK